jgi:hypothetical protein
MFKKVIDNEIKEEMRKRQRDRRRRRELEMKTNIIW